MSEKPNTPVPLFVNGKFSILDYLDRLETTLDYWNKPETPSPKPVFKKHLKVVK